MILPGCGLGRARGLGYHANAGQVAEWLKAAVLKTAEGSRPPWVRIPPCPPPFPDKYLNILSYMVNRSIWPTIKPTNPAGLPGDRVTGRQWGPFTSRPVPKLSAPCPSKPLLEQFRLGHARSLLALSQKALIAVRDAYSYPPPAVTTITAALRANHNHHHATTYRPLARSLRLAMVDVITHTTRRTVATGRPSLLGP